MVAYKPLESFSANEAIINNCYFTFSMFTGKVGINNKKINLELSFNLNEKSCFTEWTLSALPVAVYFQSLSIEESS